MLSIRGGACFRVEVLRVRDSEKSALIFKFRVLQLVSNGECLHLQPRTS